MSKIGYIRVSTKEQSTARQRKIMESYGVDLIVSEYALGLTIKRPIFQAILMSKSDTLYITSIYCLGHNTVELLTLIDTLADKGVCIVIHEPAIVCKTKKDYSMLKWIVILDNVYER